jgi:hypothetical protein
LWARRDSFKAISKGDCPVLHHATGPCSARLLSASWIASVCDLGVRRGPSNQPVGVTCSRFGGIERAPGRMKYLKVNSSTPVKNDGPISKAVRMRMRPPDEHREERPESLRPRAQ